MGNENWAEIHQQDKSWRSKLIGDISEAYVMPRYAELFEHFLGKGGPKTFLELGSGNGDMASLIKDKKFDFISRYITSEQFPEGVEWLKKKGLEAEIVDAENIPYPEQSFDVVLCFDVMHHVENPSKMAHGMMKAAKGQIFMTESNGLSVGRKLMELTPGHRKAGERSYTPAKYRSFFDHPGFKVTHFEIHPFVFPIKFPSSMIKQSVAFNQFMEKIPFFRWQCSNVYIYIEYDRV